MRLMLAQPTIVQGDRIALPHNRASQCLAINAALRGVLI
jgi:hypothetical protein